MIIRKRIEIRVRVAAGGSPPVLQQLAEQLASRGFRDVEATTPGSVRATRGKHFWSLCGAGDPRRMFHRLQADIDGMSYFIDNWFGLFTRADGEVFRTEGEVILGQRNQAALDGVLRRCRRVSIATLALFVLLGALAAVILFWIR